MLDGTFTKTRCSNCGGLLCSEIETTGDRHCNCPIAKSPQPLQTEGWICSRCGAGVSPNTSKCPCAEPLGYNQIDYGNHCLHDNCLVCGGTGIKKGGGACIHSLSCSCPKCSPTC